MIEIEFGQKTEYNLSVALGFFDCLHIGHRALINEAKKFGEPTVFTFTNDISNFLSSKDGYIYTYSERKDKLEDMGVSTVIAATFSEKFKNMSPKSFLDMLFDTANISAVVCGEDYTFGNGGKGNVEFLKKYCDEKNVILSVLPKVFVSGEVASTTLAKKYLKNGEIESLNTLLGANYSITGIVEKGKRNGTKIGFPTANITLPDGQTRLKEGVYGGYVVLDGIKRKAIINAGARPTLDSYQYKIECHIDENLSDLYGKRVEVEFIFKIRDIKKFRDLSELKNQLIVDCKNFERL